MSLSELDAWTAVAWVVVGAWVAVMLFVLRACRQRPVLRPLGDRMESVGLPRLSMVVAARNESDCIESCLRSLFRQDYPELEVVAVNDRSSDADFHSLALSARNAVILSAPITIPSGTPGSMLDMVLTLSPRDTLN